MLPKRRNILIALLLLAVCAGIAAVAVPRLFPGLGRRSIAFVHAWPGKAESGLTVSRTTVSTLADGARLLLDRDGVWIAWYRLAGRGGDPPAETAPEIETGDQVLLLRHAAESGDKKVFEQCLAWLTDHRTDGSGRLVDSAGSPATNQVTLDALRAMAEGYSAWGGRDLAASIRSLSDALLASGGILGVPADARVTLPGPTPTPPWVGTPEQQGGGTSAPSQPVSSSGERAYCALAGLDLYTMRLLSAVDARWSAAADATLAALQGAFAGDTFPLYLAGADPETGSPVPYAGDTATIDTLQTLLTVLHLCEAGEQRAESIAWIRRTLYNEGAIARSYWIVSGEPSDLEEDPAVYAVAARIARVLRDPELYQLATDRLQWHIADLRTSQAYGTVFRETQEGRIEVYAADNAWALLAME